MLDSSIWSPTQGSLQFQSQFRPINVIELEQRTVAVKDVEEGLQYIKMYVAGVSAKIAKGYLKYAKEQVILQSKVCSNL